MEELAKIFSVSGLISLVTLVVMEIVLGIDNIIFVSILAGKLPKNQQEKARQIGLTLALLIRIGLLFSITWIISSTNDLFTIAGNGFSGRDLVLMAGGLFLIGKSTTEIHGKIVGEEEPTKTREKKVTLQATIIQIVLLDIVFFIRLHFNCRRFS